MRVITVLAGVGLLIGSLVFAAPVAAGDPCYHGFDLPARTETTEPQVKLMPCAFAPTVVRVAPGTTVQFFSGPDFVHLITGANQEWGSRDEEIQPDSVVAYRFDKAGIYPFACALHRGMSGTIVVGDGVAAAGAGAAGAAVVKVSSPADPDAPSAPAAAAAASAASKAEANPAATAAAPTSSAPAPASATAAPMTVVALIGLLGVAFIAVLAARRRRSAAALQGR
jgi:plastocyanin